MYVLPWLSFICSLKHDGLYTVFYLKRINTPTPYPHTHPPASTMSTTSTHTHPPPPHSAPNHLHPYMYILHRIPDCMHPDFCTTLWERGSNIQLVSTIHLHKHPNKCEDKACTVGHVMYHGNFLSLPVHSTEEWQLDVEIGSAHFASRKGRTGGGRWVSPSTSQHMTAVVLGYRKASVVTG